ncbi:MAG: hypothetical protein U9N59_03725, partial [Campylobacterota bacterium]|nr:hypothetical protein [Campylobacterota bacterium]
ILQLYHKNYKVEQIQEYLKSQKIEIGTRRIYKFIKQNLSEKNFSLKTPSAKSTSEKNETQSVAKSDKQNTKAINAYKAKMQKIAKKD